jgi:hypothetical protein
MVEPLPFAAKCMGLLALGIRERAGLDGEAVGGRV